VLQVLLTSSFESLLRLGGPPNSPEAFGGSELLLVRVLCITTRLTTYEMYT
jgi:hypothetical protein